MIGYILSVLALTFFMYICFDEAQTCASYEDWCAWGKAAITELIFMAVVFVAGALVAVQR